MPNHLSSQSPPRPSSLYLSLDAWRGIACLWVVLFHAYNGIKPKSGIARFDLLAPVAHHGYLGVQMFFVISGYCIVSAACSLLKRGEPVAQFAKARCRRILPTYWLTLPAFVALQFLGRFLIEHHHVKAGVSDYVNPFHQSGAFWFSNLTLTNRLSGQPLLSMVAWSLNYEMAFYAACGLLLVIAINSFEPSSRQRAFLDGCHILTGFSLLLMVFAPNWALFPLDLWPQFGLGAFVYDLLLAQPSPVRKYAALTCGGLGFGVGLRQFAVGNDTMTHNSGTGWFVAVLFAGLLVVLFERDAQLMAFRTWRWLGGIGVASYSIYLLHSFFVAFLTEGLAMGHFPRSLSVFGAVGVTALSVLASLALYPLVEKPFASRKPATAQAARTVPSFIPETASPAAVWTGVSGVTSKLAWSPPMPAVLATSAVLATASESAIES